MPWYDGRHAAAPPGNRERRRRTATWSTSASRCSTSSGRTRTSAASPGRIASGTITPGEEIVVLPQRRTDARSSRSRRRTAPIAEAAAGDSVVLTLEDEIDISRGDMIVRRMNLPSVGTRVRRDASAG